MAGSKNEGEETPILVADVGGQHVKLRLSTQSDRHLVPTGPSISASEMVRSVLDATANWHYERVSVGCPAPVVQNRMTLEPHNLGNGWVGFDFGRAFGRPTKVINDAAMQALGSYEGGKMLFIGLGTGLGSAMVVADRVLPLEIAHLPYLDGLSYEDVLGQRGIDRFGESVWYDHLVDAIGQLLTAMVADYIVLGGGNVRRLETLPPNCRQGSNDNAFEGGFRLWRENISID